MKLDAKAAEWNVTLAEIRETSSSLLGFGVRDGVRVVLKIAKQSGDESHSGEVLRAYDGDGAVSVLESETNAVLLERLEPAEPLVNLVKDGNDDEATRILAHLIAKLANHVTPAICPTVADWGRGFDRYLQSNDRRISHELVAEAQHVYQELASSQGTTMLLHGDLQHYNVLFHRDRGWVAIDPKGIAGELEYETGALLRNPVELPQLYIDPEIIQRRIGTLTTMLNLNASRVIKWAFAQAVLSELWGVEDGFEINPNSLKLAQTLRSF